MGMLGGMGDLMGLMRNMGSLKEKVQKTQQELVDTTAEGSAGGGMVTATVNGRLELVELTIDPEVVDPEDVELLEDLVKAAVGQGMAAARDLQREKMGEMLGGMQLPPGMLDGLL